jgi:proliferating cell nuclear antigen
MDGDEDDSKGRVKADGFPASTWKRIMDTIKDIVNEANFQFTDNGDFAGISFQAMDASHVALIALHISNSAFQSFLCDRDFSIGLSCSHVAKISKCGQDNDALSIEYSGGDDKIELTFRSPKLTREAAFELKLMNIEQEQLLIPDTQYACTVVCDSSELKRNINELSSIGDTVTIIVNAKQMKLCVHGECRGQVVLTCESIKCAHNGELSATLTLKYLTQFFKAASLGDKTIIYMNPEEPVLFDFPFSVRSTADDPDCHMKFYLAPKIDEPSEE